MNREIRKAIELHGDVVEDEIFCADLSDEDLSGTESLAIPTLPEVLSFVPNRKAR